MGRVMGFEPTNIGTTIRGLNHLATPAINLISLYFAWRYKRVIESCKLEIYSFGYPKGTPAMNRIQKVSMTNNILNKKIFQEIFVIILFMNSYGAKFKKEDEKKLREIFEFENSTFSTPQYMLFQARGDGFVASFYQSGKFLIQGKNTQKIVEKYFEKNPEPKSENKTKIPYPHIGVDESGKGDFFGPLVIAGAYLTQENAKELIELGVCDSKKLTDKKILELEEKIKAKCIYNVVIINPKKYNEMYANFKNLNKLLAWGHATALENILNKTDAKTAISDQFASSENVIKSALKEKGKNINLIQMPKAEADTAVAAASVLARAEFVKRISKLSYEYETNLKKGCNSEVLEQAKKIAEKFGKEELKNIAKTHFKTYESV